MIAAANPNHCTCPQAIRVLNKRAGLASIWHSAEWKRESAAYRARHFPFCVRCQRVARIVPGHSGEDYAPREMKFYIDKVRRDLVEQLCNACNNAERQGKHPCPDCVTRHREDPEWHIRYIAQGEERCWICEHGGDGVIPSRKKPRRSRHSCNWHGRGIRCGNPIRRDRICPHSSKNAPHWCDPEHFMARKKAVS